MYPPAVLEAILVPALALAAWLIGARVLRRRGISLETFLANKSTRSQLIRLAALAIVVVGIGYGLFYLLLFLVLGVLLRDFVA